MTSRWNRRFGSESAFGKVGWLIAASTLAGVVVAVAVALAVAAWIGRGGQDGSPEAAPPEGQRR